MAFHVETGFSPTIGFLEGVRCLDGIRTVSVRASRITNPSIPIGLRRGSGALWSVTATTLSLEKLGFVESVGVEVSCGRGADQTDPANLELSDGRY